MKKKTKDNWTWELIEKHFIIIPILLAIILYAIYIIIFGIQWCNILFVCSCYDESVIVNYQYLYVNGTGLSIGVEHNKCHMMPCGHIDYCERENTSYYFKDAINYYPNLTKGDSLNVHWCYIPKLKEDRIREIKKQ